MATYTTPKVNITVDDGTHTAHYIGNGLNLSGGSGQSYLSLEVPYAHWEKTVPNNRNTQSRDERALCDPPVDPLEALLESAVTKAKAREVAALENARAVEKALNVERADNMRVAHDFNMSVLKFLHAGGTEAAAVAKLEEAGLGLMAEVEAVAMLDMKSLYKLNTPED